MLTLMIHHQHDTSGSFIISEDSIASHESFWRQRLATLQPIEPPYRKRGVNSPSDNVATLSLSIPDEVMGFLQERNWTSHHFLFTLFTVYLTRLNHNHNDVDYFDVALTLAPSAHGVEGFFTSLRPLGQIPLRVAINADCSFNKAYKTIESEWALCTRLQTYARDMLARYPELRSSPERQDLPPISVTIVKDLREITQTLVPESVKAGGLSLYLAEQDASTLSTTGDGIQAIIAYNRDLFEQEALGMVGHLQTLIKTVAAAPEQPIKTLPLLTEAEREQLLLNWNATEMAYPAQKCIHELFEEQAERTPNAIAVVFGEHSLTYRALNAKANQLAHYLQSLGVGNHLGAETLVGLCVERGVEMVVGILAILKAGGAYLPLDPTYPRERLAFMLEDAGVSLLLTQDHLREQLPATTADLLYLDRDWSKIAQTSTDAPRSEVTADHLALVIYTSGSTGRPKGVEALHRGIMNRCHWMWRQLPFLPGEVACQKTALSFVDSVWEIFGPLLRGVPLIIIADDVVRDPQALLAQLATCDVSRLVLVPSLLKVLLESDINFQERLPRLTTWICSGEALSSHLADLFSVRLPHAHLLNLYGSSEVAGDVTWFDVTAQRRSQNGPAGIPIGRPIDNTQIYLLDAQLQPVPQGIPGELYVGGKNLARGYYKQPKLTDERFIPNPYRRGTKLYRTGDLARWLPDGNIEYLGRVDHQVKIRGFRIELGEIEAALTQHPAVQEVVVIAREDTPGQKRLVAYVVTDDKMSSDNNDLMLSSSHPLTISENFAAFSASLRGDLQQKLPDYMVPSAFVVLEALPLTPNGKVDRQALPAPTERSGVEAALQLARTPTEEVLSAIWGEVLGIEQVGIHDNFLHLGGHSLLATQVISRLRKAFGVELPVRIIFEVPTIEKLAISIETARQVALPVPPPPNFTVSRSGDLPLSFAQQRLWFLEQLDGASATYNIPEAFRLTGRLQVPALQEAINEIIRRHEVLRTTFPTVKGQPVQRIASLLTLPLAVVELKRLTESEQKAELDRLLAEEAAEPFDLAKGPLLRVKLYQLSESDHVIQVTIHHIISDGWSMGVWWEELVTLYSTFAAGRAPESGLPELPLQYADFAQWQQEWFQGEVLKNQRAYWQTKLANAPTLLELPTDYPRPRMQSMAGRVETFELEPTLVAQLRTLSRRSGTSLFMTLYAAFSVLMSRYSGQEDIVIGSPIANRHYQEIEPLIGFFVNTLALRTDLSGNPSFEELLLRVRQVTLDAYSHQDVPFEQLVHELGVERHLSHSPLIQVMFAWLDLPNPVGLNEDEAKMTRLFPQTATAKFDLTLSFAESEVGCLQGMFEYKTALFQEATIRRMVGHLETLLKAVVAQPEQPIKRLPLLTKPERHQLLVDWNPTKVHAKHSAIHQLFEDRVEYSPDGIALSYSKEGSRITLTYKELNERANQLAHYLEALGVGRNVLVGLCMERSVEMVVGILGILKAGGAYVPLDPVSPPERLAFMLEDAQMPLLVTQERFLDKLPQDGFQVVCLDGQEQRVISKQSTENPMNGVTPDNLAYVIYTSGSTGKPKGVLVNHYNVVRLFEATDAWYGFNEKDVWTVFHSYAFDFSVWELWGALLYGGRLVVVPYDVSRSPEAFYNLLVKEQVTVLNQTPSAFRQLIQAEESVGMAPDLALRYVIFGGEALELESLRPWFERHGDQFPQLVNMYGITETTVHVTYRPISMQDLSKHGESSVIGVPIPDLQLYILDQNRQPVPIGVTGEMYVGGAGVSLGYLNRPQLTEERFIAHPFSDHPEARLYKSGDLARYLPNRDIEYLGRIDHQVKIRGFRIELGEIEATLLQHDAVREVAVIAQNSPTGGKRLVAYLVVKQKPGPTVSEWRHHLKKTLPDYMVPSAFVVMEQFPLTNNGKLDRRALPQPENQRPDLRSDYAPPRTATERTIAEVWQSLLSVPKVGVHDNFFELGGHSLLAARVVAELRQRLKSDIKVYKLFEYPTVRTLADHLDVKDVPKQSHISVDMRAKKRQAALKRRKKVVRRGRR